MILTERLFPITRPLCYPVRRFLPWLGKIAPCRQGAGNRLIRNSAVHRQGLNRRYGVRGDLFLCLNNFQE
jgi:hypothetical protein